LNFIQGTNFDLHSRNGISTNVTFKYFSIFEYGMIGKSVFKSFSGKYFLKQTLIFRQTDDLKIKSFIFVDLKSVLGVYEREPFETI